MRARSLLGAALILTLTACVPAANDTGDGIWAEEALGSGGGVLAAGQTTAAAGPAAQPVVIVRALVTGTYVVSMVCAGTGAATFTVTTTGATLNRQYVSCDRQPRQISISLNVGAASVSVSSVQPGQHWAVRLEPAAEAAP